MAAQDSLGRLQDVSLPEAIFAPSGVPQGLGFGFGVLGLRFRVEDLGLWV